MCSRVAVPDTGVVFGRKGVPEPCAVGGRRERETQTMVAAPAERTDLASAGFDSDRAWPAAAASASAVG